MSILDSKHERCLVINGVGRVGIDLIPPKKYPLDHHVRS